MPNAHDIDLSRKAIQQLDSADAIRRLFVSLGYDVDPVVQKPQNYGIENADFINHCTHVEQIAVQEGMLYVLLFEMRTVRVAERQVLARALKGRMGGRYLVVMADADYERIDFVLMDEVAAESRGLDAFHRPPRVTLNPRVLSVDRKQPDEIARRVLKRFTYTETDSDFQYDKLRAAYITAEWAEPLFNNRALFSDYYLTERLPAEPEWDDPIRDPYEAFAALMVDAREKYTRITTGQFWSDYVFPVLETLGFDLDGIDEESDQPQPDVYLYANEDAEGPLAACLAYRWDRLLDGRDDKDDEQRQTDNPGQRVVSLLERGDLPFVILTNGKLWRLYARDAHSRATNYYEIDLEETLAAPDREAAFRYFWLFFRREAFEPVETVVDGEPRRLCFIERVMAGSETYAKQLGDRLKERVFEAIFGHFAGGFIDNIREREGRDADLPQERLDLVYEATLTFLYRLMFLLYAEARDLLPVRDVRGYHGVSLRAMTGEIADHAGSIEDEAPGHLAGVYSPVKVDLYARLRELFRVIDRGDAALNVPRYNGGLFITEPGENGDPVSRFLHEYAIPDRQLALGLDRLARDVDDKTGALAVIDYKSLGVRQLGSIYEGLLEFKLRVAPEQMAIIRGKRTEEVVPYRKAKKKDIKTVGGGKNKRELTLDPGTVYLENNKQERKATGSYYTPDYIVQYIVEHTVGPVLDEKFAALRPRLDAAQQGYYTAVTNAQAKNKATGRSDESAEKYWNREDMQRLAFDVLDVKVLDPAMGSGHFLVEAVDTLTDRLLDFLAGFPHNPVRAGLTRTREAILGAMDEQGVSIDRDRLTDVNLLKRQVLKRCVYGVDLNPMAVELAKVSLWLDAFTLGAPLSFLDHHLRCGNSLIGTTAREADAELANMGGKPGQMAMFEGPFRGLLRAAEVMRGVSMLADATIEQAEQSANLFGEFEQAALPYKQLLDIYVMRAFGVKRADEFLRLYGADVMSQTHETLGKPYQQVLAQREKMFDQYRFFHWDLEFPEVFIDLEHADWKADPGFDAVVGNPPYGLEISKDEKVYYNKFDTAVGKYESYRFFLEISFGLAHQTGMFGMIVPNTWLTIDQAQSLRVLMLASTSRLQLSLLGAWVFEDANLEAMLVVAKPTSGLDSIEIVRWHEGQKSPYASETIEAQFFRDNNRNVFDVNTDKLSRGILSKMEQKSVKLDEIADVIQGLVPYRRTTLVKRYGKDEGNRIIDERLWHSDHQKDETYWRELAGGDVDRYGFEWNGKRWLSYGKWLMSWYPEQFFEGHRLVFQSTRNPSLHIRLIGTYIEEPFVHDPGLTVVKSPNNTQELFLCAYLLSSLANWQFKQLYPESLHIYPTHLRSFPIRVIDFTTPDTDREAYLTQVQAAYPGDLPALLDSASGELAAGRTDTVHDLLAFLAEQMIALNKEKQAEVGRFLGWLEETVGASIEDFTGKTFIQGYLGDYQKNEPALPWSEFEYRLVQNRRKLAVELDDVLEPIRAAYVESLAALRPIKERLAATDRLIDQIVYALYGLTEDEIRVIEGPAYEDAVQGAKETALSDKTLSVDAAAAFEYVSERVAPAAERYAELAPSAHAAASLDDALPGWRGLPARAALLLQQAEADTLDEGRIDWSGAAVNYAKAVEITIKARLFEPFREAGYGPGDVDNRVAFVPFMRGERDLTLGNYPFLFSRKETTFRSYVLEVYPDAETRLFDGQRGVVAYLTSDMIEARNAAAHERVVPRDEAVESRRWALAVLELMVGVN